MVDGSFRGVVLSPPCEHLPTAAAGNEAKGKRSHRKAVIADIDSNTASWALGIDKHLECAVDAGYGNPSTYSFSITRHSPTCPDDAQEREQMRFAEERSYREVLLVLFLTLGYPILASLAVVFDGGTSTAKMVTSGMLVSTVIYEVIVLVVVAVFLTRRGLLLEDLKLEISWRLTITGLFLAGCCILLGNFADLLLPLIGINAAEGVLKTGADGLGIPAILAISIVNPVFEEAIVVSYLQGKVLNEQAPTKAINISVGIRLSYHLYQGVAGVITIVPIGLLFSYYYYKNRKLWPLILAHGIMDFVALVSL